MSKVCKLRPYLPSDTYRVARIRKCKIKEVYSIFAFMPILAQLLISSPTIQKYYYKKSLHLHN